MIKVLMHQRQSDATEKPQVWIHLPDEVWPLMESHSLVSWRAAAAKQDWQDTANSDTAEGCSKDLVVWAPAQAQFMPVP